MTRYILDSNILDYLENSDSPFHLKCLDQFTRRIGEDLCLSILTMYEVDYSVEAANEVLAPKLEKAKGMILGYFHLLPLTLMGSKNYGKLKSAYKSHTKAKPKAMKAHTIDIILAATALEHNAVLVSNDRIFTILQGIEPLLKVENWAK